MRLSYKSKKIFYILLLFFVTFDINMTFLPNAVYVSRLLAPFLCIYAFIFCRPKINLLAFNMLPWFSLYVLWGYYRTVATQFADPVLFTYMLITSFHIFCIYFPMAIIARHWQIEIRQLLSAFLIILLLQSSFIIMEYWIPAFKNFTIAVQGVQGGNINYLDMNTRARGFSSGGASISAFLAFGLLILTLFYYERIKRSHRGGRGKKTYLYKLGYIIIMLALLYSGRTGFLILPLCLGMILAISTKRFDVFFGTKFLAVITGVFFVFFLLPSNIVSETAAYARLIRDFDISGGEHNTTFDALWYNHVFFPDTLKEFFLGDVRNYDLFRIPSDIGYIRRLFSTGMIGSFFFYMFVFICYKRIMSRSPKTEYTFFWLFALAWLFLIEAKEPFMSKFPFVAFMIISYFYYSLPSKTLSNDVDSPYF